jgi:hypothetical protein
MLKGQNGKPSGVIVMNNGYGDRIEATFWETSEKITYCIGRGVFYINKQFLKK